MANLIKWNLASTANLVNFMTTTLASLASSTLSVVSSVTQVNSSQLRVYCDAQLIVGTTGAVGSGAFFTAFVVPLIDGTNAAELDIAELQPLCVFPVTTAFTANAQHVISRTLLTVSPADFGVAVYNGTTQNATSSAGANTLGLAFYDIQTNA